MKMCIMKSEVKLKLPALRTVNDFEWVQIKKKKSKQQIQDYPVIKTNQGNMKVCV